MCVYLDNELLFSAAVEVDVYPGGPPAGETEWVTVRDKNGETVPLHIRWQGHGDNVFHYAFDVPGYTEIILTRWENPQSAFFQYRRAMLVNIENEIRGFTRTGTLIDLSEPIPHLGFHGRHHWGSGRGYIFSRSFPLLPRYWFIGSGPDSFVNVFPQYDVIGKMQSLGDPNQVNDKAHNLYMQTWITKGGIAALALMFLFGHYLLTTFLSLVRGKAASRFIYGLQLGLLASVGAFCAASMGTDSTIGSTGVFFVLLGLGYGVNAYTHTLRQTS
jgi:hypothetical protein